MEFLKTCSTNAQALGDFEAVAFQAFSVTRNTTQPSSKARDWSPSEDTRAVEGELRQAHHLVVQDASRPWIWFFKATTADKAGQTSIELPIVEGYNLHREQSGLMKSSELARPPLRSVNPNASSGSTNSPSTAGPAKASQGGGGRPAQGSAGTDQQPQPHDSFAIYELFTSSVVALISYHLVKDRQAVALNYRTFISKPAAPQDSDEFKVNNPADPHWLTNINVYWASSGTLIISTFTQTNHEIRCLDDVSSESQLQQLIGKCIRVAPSGLLAKIASFDDPIDAIAEDISQRSQRKKVRIGSVEQGIERWMSIVKRWVAWKGYSLPNLSKRSSWVRIRIAQPSQSPMPSPSLPTQAREILWPRALCFFYSTAKDIPPLIDSAGELFTKPHDRILEWFQTTDSPGFNDPLDVAQQWFLGKPERDKNMEARRKAKKAEEDAARPKEEPAGLYPSSPLNFRTGAYGDLQAVSGVYPTPPDGIVPGTVVSNADTPSVSGIILAPGGTNPAINLSAPDSHADGQQLPLTSPEFPLSVDNFGPSTVNDDLFEDMDEDEFEGNGVTDADFSFFDEPDGEDVDMLDAPVPQDSKSPLPGKGAQVKDLPPAFDADVKEESSDPLAALEDALVSASRSGKDGAEDIKTEQTSGGPTSKAADQAGAGSTQPISSQDMEVVSAPREPTSPLSPHSIEKMLFPASQEKVSFQVPHRQMPSRHRDSIFDPLSFNRKMSLSDAKYQDGRFSSRREKETRPAVETSENPRKIKSLKDLPLLTKLRYAIGVASTKGIPELTSMGAADSDESDSTSDVSSVSEEDMNDKVSIGPIPSPAGLILPAKRKLPTEGNATPMSATSFAESIGADFLDFTGLHVDEASLATFEPNSWDWSLTSFPSPAEIPLSGSRFSIPCFSPVFPSMPDTPTSQPDLLTDSSDEKPLSGKDSIAVAQIVTDQAVSATLDLLHDMSRDDVLSTTQTCLEDKWHGVIKSIFPKATECTVPTLAAVHDVFPDLSSQAKGQQRPPPRKPNEGTAVPGNHIYQINPPFIRVRRADILWDLLPPALGFWEPLGLGPVSPPKNVVAFCIYPHSDSLRPCVENFLLNLQLAYDSCKLGSHARVQTIPEYENGLVPCKVNMPASPRSAVKALRETCIQFGKVLAATHSQIREKQDAKIDAFVIYMIDPFGTPSAVWDLCSAFWTLFQSYGPGPPGRPDLPQKPDLVLQIVPIKYVASFEAPVILGASTYTNLAREVYDRCPPSTPSRDKTPLTIYTAPSFHLEEALPRNVPFKLVSEPPQDLLRENSYMHLGYAINLDGTWVTAAWTDNSGKSQAVVSYNLGTRMFGEVAKEIWQTTIEILQSRRVHWRVCIAKSGVMDREELETWVFLISCPTQLNLFITLLTVETEPSLKFSPAIPTNSSSSANAPGNTPGSTPQAGVSPDTHGLTPAATPSADPAADPAADPEARLIDTTDETWGIILAHRVHNSNSTNQFSPALISGLLVKRGESFTTSNSVDYPFADPEHGPIIVGVNILWIGAVGSTRAAQSPFPPAASGEGISPGGAPSPQERSTSSLMWTPTVQTRATAENLLKEVLGQFRALGLLAKLKGMRGTRHGTIPWHVAAAKRGVQGLGRVLNGS